MTDVAVRPAKLVIRKGTIEDHPRLVEMAGHFIEGTGYRSLFKHRPAVLGPYVMHVVQHGQVFVAERDGEILGFLAGFAMIEPIAGLKVFDELAWWVEPAYRKGSVGPRLLQAVEVWSRQKGIDLIKMIAPVDTEVGRFYARSGYRAVETLYLKPLGR